MKRPLTRAQAERYIWSRPGDIPVIISGPHAGTEIIPGLQARTDSGIDSDPDLNILELVQDLAGKGDTEPGRSPGAAATLFHRQYADANRPPATQAPPADYQDEAFIFTRGYEDGNGQALYNAFYRMLDGLVRQGIARFQSVLLLDLHGYGADLGPVHWGTFNGLCVEELVKIKGWDFVYGPGGLKECLNKAGIEVYPERREQKEKKTLSRRLANLSFRPEISGTSCRRATGNTPGSANC